jgi:hypothetical protein
MAGDRCLSYRHDPAEYEVNHYSENLAGISRSGHLKTSTKLVTPHCDGELAARELTAPGITFTTAGFRLAVISEPHPAPGARERFPDELADKSAFLCFLFFVLEAV